jgi:uncharacterized protein YciI
MADQSADINSLAADQGTQQQIGDLLSAMIRKTLYAVISRVNAAPEEILPHVVDHLTYMDGLEAKGLLWASGPFVQPGVLVGDGLTIFRTASLEEARQLIEDEPLTKLNLRTYEIHPWELREGKITVDLNASTSTFDLG